MPTDSRIRASSRFFRRIAALFLYVLMPAGRAVDFSTAEADGIRITVCRVNTKKEPLALFLEAESGRPFHHFNALRTELNERGKKLIFAMNAGMFHPDFSPVGLFIQNAREAAPLNTAEGEGNFFLKPNGIFAVTESMEAAVVETGAWPAFQGKVTLATQSGPMLVINGRIHPEFQPASKNLRHRNGVGVPEPGTAVFAISEEPISFHAFAVFFRDHLRCPNALFLDGGISSLYAPALSRNDRRADLGPILAVTE